MRSFTKKVTGIGVGVSCLVGLAVMACGKGEKAGAHGHLHQTGSYGNTDADAPTSV